MLFKGACLYQISDKILRPVGVQMQEMSEETRWIKEEFIVQTVSQLANEEFNLPS